nr:hypothetical protein [Tanacetum cinerariifolium]
PVLVDEGEDPEEEEFKEAEEPQEEDDDMEVDIEEDENELELTYPYEEVDPLNSPSSASESEPEDVTDVENTIKHKDETVSASIHKVGKSSTAPFLREDSDGLLPGLMRRDINSLFGQKASFSRRLYGRETAHALVEKKGKEKDEYYGKLILELGNEVHSSVEQRTAAMEKLVERLGIVEEKAECKKLKKELEEARGFVFDERPNEAIDVLVKDEERTLKESQGNHLSSLVSIIVSLLIMSPKSAPLTQIAIRRMLKESVDAAIAAERARHANVGNDARGLDQLEVKMPHLLSIEKIKSVFGISECVEGKKVKFAAVTLQGPALTWWNAKVATIGLETVNQMPWTKMKQLMTAEFNELALMCPRMVESERVKVDAYIRGLTDNIKGEVTSSKPANMNEAMRMAHKLMEQKSQARNERLPEGKKQK